MAQDYYQHAAHAAPAPPRRSGPPTAVVAVASLVTGAVVGVGGTIVALGGGATEEAKPTPTVTTTANVVNVVVPQSCQMAVVLGKDAIQAVLDGAADSAARDAALEKVQAFSEQGAACQDASE